jgi:hypothetical protein
VWLYTLENLKSEAAILIKGLVFDEMRHFGIACNLLRATGAQPKIFAGYDNIVYSGSFTQDAARRTRVKKLL